MKNIFIIIICLVFTLTCFTQNPYIQNIKNYDYNAADKNWSITQDSTGYIYFGNDAGLLQYNGIAWSLFPLKNSGVVRSVYAVGSLVYSGGYEEFGVWRRNFKGDLVYKSLSKDLPPNSFKNDDIWKILDKGDKIYFQSFRSIYVYDKSSSLVQEVTGTNILFLTRIYDEYWTQKIRGGLYKFNGKDLSYINKSDIFKNTTVQTILPYHFNEYLIITSTNGLFIYNGLDFTPFSSEINLSNKEVNSALLAADGNYYIGTILDGIYVLNSSGKLLNHYNIDNQLANNTVLSLFEDADHDIWVGLDKGISCIKRFSSLSFYVDDKSKIGATYAGVIFDGRFFIGTNQGLYYIDFKDPQEFISLSQFKSIESIKGQVWDLEVVDNLLYCGTNRGLFVIDQNLNITSPYNINTGVFDIFKDTDHSIYLGTYTSLYKIDLSTNYATEFETIKEPIIKVEKDHLGNIWLEHMNKGVYRCKLDETQNKIEELYYYGNSEKSNLPYSLHLFKVGGRVSLLGSNSFYIYDDIINTFSSYDLLDSIFNKTSANLKNIYTIDKNLFWLVADNAAFKIYCNGSSAKIIDNVELPFKDISFVNNFERVIALNDSLDLICLDKGFILSFPNRHESESKNTYLSTPFLVGINATNSINSDTIFYNTNEAIEIPNDHNTITFRFFDQSAISSNLYFQYKLDGFTEWSKPMKADNIAFQRLPSGKYTLRLRALDTFNHTSDDFTYTFTVNKPWYLSWLAFVFYVIFLGLVTYIIKYQVNKRYLKNKDRLIREIEHNQLRKYNFELESRVKEKDAELLAQTSSIIKKNELMHRIKEEFEVFNDKYPTKNSKLLFYKINTLLNTDFDSDDDWKSFMLKFEQMHPFFFKKLKENYPQLTSNDLKLCACLRLNLDSKDIASFMNITVRAVENSRSRLRKKIDLPSDKSLIDFFISY